MTRANDRWFRRRLFHSRNLTAFPLIALLPLCVGAGMLTRAQESSKDPQIAAQSGNQKSKVLAPGIEHIQFTRGYKSDKEATGPWLINMLRIDLRQSRLRLVHALDEAVGLETVSSMA